MNEDMAAYFDGLAPGWDDAPAEQEAREKLTAMMALSPNGVIADVGCGRGVMFEHLLRTGPAKLIAIDVSSEMLRLAKERFCDGRIEYVHGDFLDVSLPPLDAVLFFNAYPHFLDKAALAGRLAQVLKKGGALIIAHSRSRAEINGRHRGGGASKLSAPLESAEAEAAKFQKDFATDALVDGELYFIKMIRR